MINGSCLKNNNKNNKTIPRVGHGNLLASNFSTHEAEVGGWSFSQWNVLLELVSKQQPYQLSQRRPLSPHTTTKHHKLILSHVSKGSSSFLLFHSLLLSPFLLAGSAEYFLNHNLQQENLYQGDLQFHYLHTGILGSEVWGRSVRDQTKDVPHLHLLLLSPG